MRRVRIIIIFTACVICSKKGLSVPVDIDFNYTISVQNYYDNEGVVSTLSDYAVNSNAVAIDFWHPSEGERIYNGGSAGGYADSEQYYGIMIWFNWQWIRYDTKSHTHICTENWSFNYLQGTLSIGTNSSYPQGSSVPVEVYYEGILETPPNLSNLHKSLSIFSETFSNCVYSISGEQQSTTTINLVAGNEYNIIAYLYAGTPSKPFSQNLRSSMYFSFNAIPEPASILLFALIGLPLIKTNSLSGKKLC